MVLLASRTVERYSTPAQFKPHFLILYMSHNSSHNGVQQIVAPTSNPVSNLSSNLTQIVEKTRFMCNSTSNPVEFPHNNIQQILAPTSNLVFNLVPCSAKCL